MFTALFVMSSVSTSTRGLESSLHVTLESVGRSVLGWVGFISDCCGEGRLVCEVIVFERVGVGYLNAFVAVCALPSAGSFT
jgi:hypothetical protein